MNKKYYLVHITTDGEYKTPLVASQLFDRAEFQAKIQEGYAPAKVEVWIIGAMREYFEKAAQQKIKSFKDRCPNITIKMLNGVGRLKGFPLINLLKANRKRLGKNEAVIYHCRGESAARWAVALRKYFPSDKVVLDVRGYWPAELLYNRGIENPEEATGANRDAFIRARNALREMISKADAVTTISPALLSLLQQEADVPPVTAVIPCCVSNITTDERRSEIRREWGIKDNETLLIYSGTTAAYQHLRDLTIPFLKRLAEQDSSIRLAFLSSEIEKIEPMIKAAGLTANNIILKHLPQKEVAAALTAGDAGILIRKPTIVNRVANPVKIAEYIASGLPVIIEHGIGGVSEHLFQSSLFKGINIASGQGMDSAAKEVIAWLHEDMKSRRNAVREYAAAVYLWRSAVHTSRKMYRDLLENKVPA